MEPKMLDFVKAMSDVDRLRIIGLLSLRPASAMQVADELHLPPSDAHGHLEYLAKVGLVSENGGQYQLEGAVVESLARDQFAGRKESYVPAPNLDAKSRRVLAANLNPDGSLQRIPAQPEKLKVILEYLLAAFEPGVDYTEKEVNTILRRFHVDVSGLRRDLIDAKLMARESDGSRYWKIQHG